jgi:hypoxanthine phosphoribosyltransferase
MSRERVRLKPLLGAAEIDRRVGKLAARVAVACNGRPIVLLPILSGSLIFTADLVRRLPLDMVIQLCGLSSYRGDATEPGRLEWTLPPPDDLAGRHVLIVDDIVDTGATLGEVTRRVRAQSPASVRSCVLLKRDSAEVEPDFYGFRIGEGFVVGYGLDYNGRFRNLPDIAVLEPATAGVETEA